MLKFPRRKIPVVLVTGFLGAGKTSLLNRLLKTGALQQSCFIVNEFGAVGLDSLLMETADETMIELTNGCLCCTIKGDLPDTIAALLVRADSGEIAPPRRLIIETTGLSDPAPIMRAVLGAPFLQPFISLSQVLAVVDIIKGAANLERFAEARRQIGFADKIIISKTDLKTAKSALPHLLAQLHKAAAAAEIIVAPPAGDPAAEMAFCEKLLSDNVLAADSRPAAALTGEQEQIKPPEDRHNKTPAASGSGHGHDPNRHKATIRAYALSAAEPVPLAAAEHFSYQLARRYGEKILRFKALIYSDKNHQTAWVLQAVQGQVYPPQPVAAANLPPAGGSRLVLITDGVPEQELRDLWQSCRNIPAIDRADYAALSDNPLAIPGLKF